MAVDNQAQHPALGLRPTRPPVRWPRVVTGILLSDLALRCAIVLGLLGAWEVQIDGEGCVFVIEAEVAVTALFLMKYARWEDQGHLITSWQVLSGVMVYLVRRELYRSPLSLVMAALLLVVSYIVGLVLELTAPIPVRLPPFGPKSEDAARARHGWLGATAASLFKSRLSRSAITAAIFVTWQTRMIIVALILYSMDEDVHGLTAEGLTEEDVDILFYTCIGIGSLLLLPNLVVELACFPGHFWDWWTEVPALRAYRTGPYEVCELQDDDDEHSQLSKRLAQHQCRSLTVVIPAYMPNEESILFDVLDFYRAREQEYPGVMRVMLVWNSPREHPDVESQLEQLQVSWSSLTVVHNRQSTSKCDNLNHAIELLDTDMALLNDMDTMVSTATMCRASIRIFEEEYDIAQSVNIHCKEDTIGRPESGCFCYGPLVTLFDASKPLNVSVHGSFGHSPFNGRGGFWRTASLRKVGFDHRTVGEDHDAAYRGFAYFGMKGILDPNMLCQEREPPSCTALTSQRIRWETAGLEMRRTFPWVLRSEHYSRFEAFVLLWSQLSWAVNLPLQMMPLQVCQIVPFGVVKSYVRARMLRSSFVAANTLCTAEGCVATFSLTWPSGQVQEVVLPFAFLVFILPLAIMLLTCTADLGCRLLITRYRPRWLWAAFMLVARYVLIMPYLLYLQLRAFHDFSWGVSKFVPTARSPPARDPSTLSVGYADVESAMIQNQKVCKLTEGEASMPLLWSGG